MARSNAAQRIKEIAQSSSDPKAALLKAIGKIDKKIRLHHSQVLVATFIQPERTKSGLYLPEKTLGEDQFQGNTGLVIAMGPGAYKDDTIAKFHGVKIKVGDWVLYRPADGMQLLIGGVPCRIFEDVNIKADVQDPMDFY